MSLFRNYLLSLLRNAVRDKFFTLLNLLGLAVGITAAILIFIYIQDQLTYDKHNENLDRIYRLEADFTINEKQDLTAITQIPLGPTLKDDYPEIVEQARILPRRISISSGRKILSRKTASCWLIPRCSRYLLYPLSREIPTPVWQIPFPWW